MSSSAFISSFFCLILVSLSCCLPRTRPRHNLKPRGRAEPGLGITGMGQPDRDWDFGSGFTLSGWDYTGTPQSDSPSSCCP